MLEYILTLSAFPEPARTPKGLSRNKVKVSRFVFKEAHLKYMKNVRAISEYVSYPKLKFQFNCIN